MSPAEEGQEPTAPDRAVGTDELGEVVAVVQLPDRLLGAPATATDRQALRSDRAQAGDADPRPALVSECAATGGEGAGAVFPWAGIKVHRTAVEPHTPLLFASSDGRRQIVVDQAKARMVSTPVAASAAIGAAGDLRVA